MTTNATRNAVEAECKRADAFQNLAHELRFLLAEQRDRANFYRAWAVTWFVATMTQAVLWWWTR